MGLDYSYELFLKREHVWNALEAVIEHSTSRYDEQIIIEFPDGDFSLPLGTSGQAESRFTLDELGYNHNFPLSCWFENDEAIEKYIEDDRAYDRKHGLKERQPILDSHGRVAIGSIYLSIFGNLNIYSSDDYDPDLVKLRFTAATTSMSLLFEASNSIRDTFTLLLMLNKGEFALFDRENDAYIISWKKQPMSKRISDNWLPQHEIERIANDDSIPSEIMGKSPWPNSKRRQPRVIR